MFSHQRLLILMLCICAVGFGQSTFWPSTTTPATSSANDSKAVTLGLKFSSDVPGKVTGVRFFKGRYNTGTHVGQLWNATGTLLSSVTFTNETKSGWQQANFSSPVSISAKTTYVVSYSAPNGRYAINTNYSWSGLSASPLYVAGSSPGVFQYGSGSRFPTSSWTNNNYWVDVVFVPDTAAPPAPVQISVSPTSASLNGGQSKQFSASVSGTRNTGVTWSLSPQIGSISTGGLYTAPAAVSSAQTVTVTARSVADSTKSASAAVSLALTPAPSGVSFWNSQAIPSNPQNTSDGKSVTLGVRFASDVPGRVLGIRFYKGPNNIGTHLGNLWSASGTSLGQLNFANETGSGWQHGYFSTPISIPANTTYVASYFAPNGNYAFDQFFNWPNVSVPPLRFSGNDPGVYRYGTTTGFPSSTWNSANYWVDVIFVPDTVAPPAPVQISVSPTSVSLDSGQSQQFSASVSGTTNTGVTWSLSPQVGSISASGLYTAPATASSAQTVAVTAHSVADSTKSASATVSLVPPAPVVEVSVSPTSVSLNDGQSQQFSASVSGTTNTGVTWSLSPQVGSISASGLYTAPATVIIDQTVTVTARSVADSTKSASVVVSLALTPAPRGVSFWNSQAIPSNPQNTSDGKSVSLGIRFASDVPGKVLGIRFYKGPNNIGTHLGNLWSASGTNLGELIFTNETGSGWQDGYFATPILISTNTTYVASYFAPKGNYAHDQFFNWPSVSAAPLRVSGNDPGVYRYGPTAGFPSSTWNSANYWVDVIFQPDLGTEPPPSTTYTISGNVSGTSATVTLSGPKSATTTTNSSGNYSFTALQNGLYVVVPSKTGYEFSPSSASVTVDSASVSGINFTAAALPPAPRSVTLNWNASPSSNVVGYNLYRSTASGGPYSKINPSPINGTSFVDNNVTTAPTYYYVATAVDNTGLESTFSNQATAPME